MVDTLIFGVRSFFMGNRNNCKKQKNEISVAKVFVNTALWFPKHGNSALQNLGIFVGGCFPLPTYRNSANYCKWLNKFSLLKKKVSPSQARSGGRNCSFQVLSKIDEEELASAIAAGAAVVVRWAPEQQ